MKPPIAKNPQSEIHNPKSPLTLFATMHARPRLNDQLLLWLVRGAAAVAGAIVLLIAGFLISESLPALHEVGPRRLVTDADWYPDAQAATGTFRLIPALAGTLLTTAGAVLLAAPLGVVSALFCRFYAPRVVYRPFRTMIELLAGIPSVVYGLWGLTVLVPLIGRYEPPGASLLAGIIVLAVMILPTVALLAESTFAGLPPEYLSAAAALGLTRWRTIRGIVLPASRPGLFTAVLLATARALGETMAVLMVCGNIVQVPHSLFDPVRTLTANIALEMGYALGVHRSALFVSGLLLLAVVALLVMLAEFISRRPANG